MDDECKPASTDWEGSTYECPDCGTEWYLDLSIREGEHCYTWEKQTD